MKTTIKVGTKKMLNVIHSRTLGLLLSNEKPYFFVAMEVTNK